MTLQLACPELVLASGSAARAALLKAAGLTFAAIPASVDESAIKRVAQAGGASPEDTALRLAHAKAAEVAATRPGALVIGADQLLVCGTNWFDKPEGADAARRQLLALRAQTHVLATAVTVHRGDTVLWSHVATPCLTMRRFSGAFLDAYLRLDADHLISTVGGYRIEGPGMHLFERIEGDHSAILGLPMLPLLACLRSLGLLIE